MLAAGRMRWPEWSADTPESQRHYHKAAKMSGLRASLDGGIVLGKVVEGGVVEIVEFGIQAAHGY